MGVRIVLGLSVLIWLPYGIYCFFNPGFLATAAGVTATDVTGAIELRSMYGGVQGAIGVVCLLGLFRARLERSALILLIAAGAGLGTARLIASLWAGEFSEYNVGGLAFEWGTVAAAFAMLPRARG